MLNYLPIPFHLLCCDTICLWSVNEPRNGKHKSQRQDTLTCFCLSFIWRALCRAWGWVISFFFSHLWMSLKFLNAPHHRIWSKRQLHMKHCHHTHKRTHSVAETFGFIFHLKMVTFSLLTGHVCVWPRLLWTACCVVRVISLQAFAVELQTFFLPCSLADGYGVLRCYTSWKGQCWLQPNSVR